MADDPVRKVQLKEGEDFSEVHSFGKRIVTPVRYSTDVRDVAWMKENVPCQAACPAGTNIPGYIGVISEGRVGRSYELNRIANVLPGVLGRICSRPCEDACRHAWPGNGEPVAICHLKRYAADFKPIGHRNNESLFTPTGKRIAIVGAGPAGVAAAYDLTTLGHDVTLYEKEEKPGGMLAYGIPEFRLPRDILEVEVHNAIRMGVELKTGVSIGKGENDIKLSQLNADYDAVLLSTGCMAATPLPLDSKEESEDVLSIPGVEYGLDFLVDLHRGVEKTVGKKVAIVGAGFTAFDCARVALRLGAEEVTIHLRTGEEYIPVPHEEIFEAKKEGVKIGGLRSPVGLIKGDNGELTGVRFIQNRLGGWRAEGRRQALGIEGSEFEVACDTLLIAIGQLTVNDYHDQALELDRWGNVRITDNGMTSVKGIFAAGDYVSGPSTVIAAIGHGREIALGMDKWLMGVVRRKQVVKIEAIEKPIRERAYDFIPLQQLPTIPVNERLESNKAEVETGYDKETAEEEAKRCYLCYLRYEIDVDNCIYCRACIEVAPRNCIKLVSDIAIKEDGTHGELEESGDWSKVGAIWIDNKECIRCGACFKVCPTQCISITRHEMFNQDI